MVSPAEECASNASITDKMASRHLRLRKSLVTRTSSHPLKCSLSFAWKRRKRSHIALRRIILTDGKWTDILHARGVRFARRVDSVREKRMKLTWHNWRGEGWVVKQDNRETSSKGETERERKSPPTLIIASVSSRQAWNAKQHFDHLFRLSRVQLRLIS